MTEQVATMEITGIAAGGDGVGRVNNMVAFVPRTAPGDLANVTLTVAKRFARGHLNSVERPSELRVDPRCEHYKFDKCGGCQLQHLNYEAQLAAKEQIIVDSIRRIGKRELGPVPVMSSDSQWRYRRKLTLHVRKAKDRWIAGLHPYDDARWVFDLKDCPITDDRVLAVWKELRPAFELLPDERSFRISVRLVDDGAAVVVEGGTSWPTAQAFFEAAASIHELWWKPEEGRVRRINARQGTPTDGASFAQVNAGVAAKLKEQLLTRVRSYSPRTVIDAYAGSGDTTLPLVSSGVAVTAIELDVAAVKSFRDQLDTPSRAIAGAVEDHVADALPADVVILNPPRTGIDARVATILQDVKKPPRAILYVSCDPATLARDLARLGRYRLASVTAYDMFPQTAHVETICELVPEKA